MATDTSCCSQTAFSCLHSTPTVVTSSQITCAPCLSFATLPSSHRRLSTQPRGIKSPNYISPFAPEEGGNSSDSDADVKKSRNQKKRQARLAVRWGMDLASFSAPQIKRILRLGPDVREGKRRQFNYIGKLLRDVQPDLMDALIHSTKDGDWSRLQAFGGSVAGPVVVNDEELEETEYDDDDDDEELRKLVRRVHTAQERKDIDTENEQEVEAAVTSAEKSLARFLHAIAKQMPSDPDFTDSIITLIVMAMFFH